MTRLWIAPLLAFGASNSSFAHHAFAADYEPGNEGTIRGTVTEVRYRNPDARYCLAVTNDDGSTELWDLETMKGCDPYSFFRQLYLEGKLEEFWDRAKYRR